VSTQLCSLRMLSARSISQKYRATAGALDMVDVVTYLIGRVHTTKIINDTPINKSNTIREPRHSLIPLLTRKI
jgi:hypothetical protein